MLHLANHIPFNNPSRPSSLISPFSCNHYFSLPLINYLCFTDASFFCLSPYLLFSLSRCSTIAGNLFIHPICNSLALSYQHIYSFIHYFYLFISLPPFFSLIVKLQEIHCENKHPIACPSLETLHKKTIKKTLTKRKNNWRALMKEQKKMEIDEEHKIMPS